MALLFLGRHFNILTDHRALSYLNTCRLLSPRITRWVMVLLEYDFNIEYVPGKNNVIADCLSRSASRLPVPEDRCFKIFMVKIPHKLKEILNEIKNLQKTDPKLRAIIENTDLNNQRFVMHGDCLYYRNTNEDPYLLCIPRALVEEVVTIYHEYWGHYGVYKTWDALKRDVWWQNQHRDVKRVVRACQICQKSKVSIIHSPPLESIVTNSPNEIHSLDLYGPLPRSRGGVAYLLVCLDLFSKLVSLYPLKKATSKSIINALFKYHFPRVGVPAAILSDHGTQFISASWNNFLGKHNIKSIKSSVRHPSSNPVERVMRELGRLFRTFCSDNHKKWANEIINFEFFINSVRHETTGFTPLELHFGKESPTLFRKLLDYPQGNSEGLTINSKITLARESLLGKSSRMMVNHPKRPYRTYEVGELVLLRANPVSSVLAGETKKFMLLFEGPYRIKKKIFSNTYILSDLESSTERGMFHTCHLKPYISTGKISSGCPPVNPPTRSGADVAESAISAPS